MVVNEENIMLARWGFAALLIFSSLMMAVLMCWLHEHDIHLSEPILKFLRRPVGEVLIVLVCAGGLVQHGATKGFFGGPRMMAPREMQTELVSAPESVDAVAGMFSSYTNVVTNVCATGIMPAETSVFLRAHWPWNLYPVPTGIEVYASPQLSTNQWVGIGTAPVIGSDNSAIIELPYSVLPDGWTSSMFFMLGLNIDTDQDGLSDSFERIISKTDPNLADTDGDGMPDGWEYNNGLNPLSDPTDDEANADADGDGISNIAEMGYGTDPQKRDSDGDGIDDLGELGSVRQLDDFVWYDTSVGVNILTAEVDSAIDDKVWTVDLHYPAVIGGKVYDRISIDSNALVYLIPSNGIAVTQSRYSYNSLPASSLAQTNIAVAVNWRDMNLNRQSGSQVRVAHVASNNCTVVEFVNLERRSYPSDRMTAQVVVLGGTDGTILVNYLSLTENLDGRSATVGLMDSSSRTYANINKFYALQWSYSRSGAIAPQMTLAYCVGTGTNPTENDTDGDGLSDDEEIFIAGTDPCLFDTDGDGLSDGDEVERRTNPLIVDTDSDGMPDGWEVANGFNPRVADGTSDADSDGLSNLLEWQNGTNPRNPDTDDDELIDSREVAWIEEGISALPWFTVMPLRVVEASGDQDRALYGFAIPFDSCLAGELVDVAVADVNGVVYFGNSTTTNGLSSSDGGSDLKYDTGKHCAIVAGYWSDLRMRSSLASKITFGTAQHDGATYFVIQYENVGTYHGSTSNKISFQVSICESMPDIVYIRYGSVIDDRSGYALTIGAQGGEDDNWDNYPKLNRFYGSNSYPILGGRTIVYHFGCGGDPHDADTDGDGLADVEEVSARTNPRKADSDGDELDDGWEIEYGLDPLSVEERDGAEGDFDNDGIENVREYDHQTNPASADTDDDGLSDGEEMGFITAGNAIPWLSLDESEDVTLPLLDEYRNRCSLKWTLPTPLRVQGELVTNLTLTSRGWLFFNKAGYANPGHSTGSNGIDYYVDKNTLALAVYGDGSLLVSTNLTDRSTSVRVGTAMHQGVGYAVVECVNMYRDQPSYRTNSISWQVAVPTNVTEHVYVRYRDVTGEYVDGRYATVGMQSFGAKWMCGYCESGKGLVHEGLALDFHLGRNSNPNDGDTDGDSLSDLQEVALGTNLNSSDTDGDSLPDGWEVGYGLDPLSAVGDDGALGDFDGDGLLNVDEYAHGTNPALADTDGDGLSDLMELGGVTTNFLPRLQFETQTNLTASFEYAAGSVVTWPLPEPIYLHGVCVTEVTIDSHGLAYFNRKGTRRTWSAGSESRMTDSWTVNANSYTVAPYWGYLYLTEETPASVISAGTATIGTNRYLVIQYDGVCPYDNRTRQGVTNSVSWQLAVPYGDADRMCVRYSNQTGTTDGREASVGYQDFNGVKKASYCYREAGRIFDGASVSFAVGTNTDPLNADTLGEGSGDYSVYQSQVDPSTHDADDDGLPDAEERARGTNLMNADTDGDGMPDGWEVRYGFNPCVATDADGDADNDGVTNLEEGQHGSNPHSADTDGDGLPDGVEVGLGTSLTNADTDNDGLDDSYEYDAGLDPCHPDTDRDGLPDGWEVDHGLDPDCATGDDGTDGDPDNDGLSNVDEYQNGCDPQEPDTDGDGVNDGVEVGQGSDPTDASDHGVAPPAEKFRELVFNINGDYAAWEMTIEGQGPDDTRTRKITMGAPNAAQNVPLKMRKGNSYRLSMRWLNSDGHTNPYCWYCWQAKIDDIPSACSYQGYSTQRLSGNEVLVGPGWVAENADGLLSGHVHTHDPDDNGYGGGNVAEGLVATLYVLDDPKLIPDYDRDGEIDDEDERTASDGGRDFRFWTNDDSDRSSSDGDTARAVADEFPVNGLDWDSGRVNGRRDLIDYAAIQMDLKPVVDSVPGFIRSSLTFRLRHAEGALNAVWSTMGKRDLASFFKNDLSGFGSDLSQVSRSAEKGRIGSGGLAVPDGFAALAKAGGNQGVFWVDGRQSSVEPLWVEVLYDSRVICSNKLEMSISNVEDMYRWLNQRGVCGASVDKASSLGEPWNFPDRESDGGQFVFVHGYNVDEHSARAWSAEMFKRLWQSGSRKMFTAATWYGNDSQSVIYLGNTPDYYSNVDHALSTAATFKRSVAALPGTSKYVAAHSLGNMLVSSAIAEHGLVVTRYFMLNAAVPIEAYAPSAITESTRTNMTPADWRPYVLRLRANHWHELFDGTDARRDLTWKGRFASIGDVVNYYSVGEDVLNNSDGTEKNLFSANYAWANQEMRKGIWPLLLPGNNEAGWSFNIGYNVVDPDSVSGEDAVTIRRPPAQAAQLTDVQLKRYPFFGAFDDMSICTTNRIVSLPQKNQLLADAIPAESYAAGRNQIPGFVNLEMQGKRSGGGDWTHSFIVEAPYAWTYEIFDDIKERIR